MSSCNCNNCGCPQEKHADAYVIYSDFLGSLKIWGCYQCGKDCSTEKERVDVVEVIQEN